MNSNNLREEFDRQYGAPTPIYWRWSCLLPEFLHRFLFPFFVYDLTPPGWDKTKAVKVFIPGWIPNPLQTKELIWEFFRRGERVAMADVPHGLPGFFRPQRRKADAVVEMLMHLKIDSAIAVTHSEGSLVFEEVATFLRQLGCRQRFQGAVLVEAAGVSRRDSFLSLWRRGQAELRAENARRKEDPSWYEFWWQEGNFWSRGPGYYLALTLPWTLWEAVGIARANILSRLEDLRRQGMKIVAAHGDESRIFPIRDVRIAPLLVVGVAAHQDVVLRPAFYYRSAIQPLLAVVEAEGEEEAKR